MSSIEGENQEQSASSEHDSNPWKKRLSFIAWVLVNIFSTIGIVFLNRAILSSENFKHCPTFFVAFHFGLTSLTLWILSTEKVNAFTRKAIPWRPLLPICVVHGASTIFANASLASLEVPTYQLIRVLVTPITVAINFLAFKTTISRSSAMMLALTCVGVAFMSASDAKAKGGVSLQSDTFLGYSAGLAGVTLAAAYGILVARQHKQFEATSMQLLAAISPLSCGLLSIIAPFVDTLPVLQDVSWLQWILVCASGGCAVLINVSQFCIIAQSSALSSTVVGHTKTCLIVALGWSLAQTVITANMGLGIASALSGIIGYSIIQQKQTPKLGSIILDERSPDPSSAGIEKA